MNTHTLMDPDYLKAEIKYLEFLVPQRAERLDEIQSRITEAFDVLRATESPDKITILTETQRRVIVHALAACEVDLRHQHYVRPDEFFLKVYKTLLKDRRWLIASKLKFLKKQ